MKACGNSRVRCRPDGRGPSTPTLDASRKRTVHTHTPFHPAICYPRFPPDQPPPDKQIAFHYIAWMRYIIEGIRNVEAFFS